MSDKPVVQKPLPKLADLQVGNFEVLAKFNELNILLNQEPKKEWVRQHPTVKVKNAKGESVPLEYIPIGVVEYLLTAIYVKWRVEIKSSKLIANSVVVEVRLHVLDPITGTWDWQDGIGASPIQIKANSGGAIDFQSMQSAAIQMAAPAAESYAISDAADKLGKLFGKDLNRGANRMNYTDMQMNQFNSVPISADLESKLIAKGKSGPEGLAEVEALLREKHMLEEATKQRIAQQLNIHL